MHRDGTGLRDLAYDWRCRILENLVLRLDLVGRIAIFIGDGVEVPHEGEATGLGLKRFLFTTAKNHKAFVFIGKPFQIK